ncbi:MAG: putative nucleotidyltransferase [Patescibacteria group bacterium]|jgi:predicted nucleotidyltransferase
MTQTIEKNIQIAKKYIKRLHAKIEIKKAIIFGSRYNGDFYPDSDTDIVIVSKTFKNKFTSKRNLIAQDEWEQTEIPLQALCYTPEEYNERKDKINIVNEAIKTGYQLI